MMTIVEDVAGKVTALLEKYQFNANTLAKYLEISLAQVNDIAHGKTECLLEVLVSCHHLSPTAIAKMSGVDVGDVEKMLSGVSTEVDIHSKYEIAVTAMALRFFLKDCEPTI